MLPYELVKIILEIKWWSARKERLKRILKFPHKTVSVVVNSNDKSQIFFLGKRVWFLDARWKVLEHSLFVDDQMILLWSEALD